MEQLLMYYGQFMELSKANPIVASVLATGVSGGVIMGLRNLPGMIFNRFKRLVTLELQLEDPSNIITIRVITQLMNSKGLLLSKNLLIQAGAHNNKYDEKDEINSLLGTGIHYWIYKGRLWSIAVFERDSAASNLQKRGYRLRTLSLTSKPKDILINDAIILNEEREQRWLEIRHGDVYAKVKPRPLESVILNKGVMENLISIITTFLEMEDWYAEKGIPYKLNIMLAGPPGTGKSSIIAAIGSYFKSELFDKSGDLMLEARRSSLSGKLYNIQIMEDLDSHPLFKNLTNGEANKLDENRLGMLLNSLSGVGIGHGSVVITTSNDLSVLPEQLLRPSRMDYIIEIGYLNQEAIGRYIEFMYGEKVTLLEGTPEHRASYLQQVFMNNRHNVNTFLETISTPEVEVEHKSYLKENKPCLNL